MMLLGLGEVLATLVADRSIAVSNNTRRWVPWVRTNIPNGVDLSRFHPGEKSENPSILFVGTYLRRKRGKLLAEVFAREVRPAVRGAELWMVSEDAPPAPGVKVLGRVSEAELVELYQRAWVFCLPSSYEGFGIPYIEAMASGCPVVATPNPGALEVTESGGAGIVTPPNKLGAELISLLASEARRARFAALGIARAQQFDLRLVASTYENLYQELLSSRRTVTKSPS
jgi:glycosyltransferase involved in cell wall biosynthesis